VIGQPSAAKYLGQLPGSWRVRKIRCTDKIGMEAMVGKGQA
jgi:hypothetical protein